MAMEPTGARKSALLVAGVLLAVVAGGLLVRGASGPAPATEPAGLPFRVPPGFTAERVAGPPVVEYPMTATFDESGRLFVAHAAGLNVRNTETLLKERPNSVRLLAPADDRGRFTRFTVFADRLTFPAGALWHDDALYCCSAPYLWKMQDTRGAGVADKRQELVGKFHFDGHAADIKGPFLGPDGRLYWTDGPDGHEVPRRDGNIQRSNSPVIWRCKPDGDDLEIVSAGGGNPVMMTFTDEGEPFATTTLLRNYPARYDGMIYCLDGAAFLENPSDLFRSTGDLLPAVTNLGHVAPSGLTRYRGDAFGPEYRDNLFVTEYNTHKVVRLVLERDGAAFKTREEDFIVSDSDHFHPTFVAEDADGSLLVVDTGGWITVACYVSLLKPEAKGGIYRIRRKGAPKVADPRGLALKWDRLSSAELAGLLDDPRFVVRDRAVRLLAKQGTGALPVLRDVVRAGPSVRARRNAVWAATRMEVRDALALVRTALEDRDVSVRLAAVHAAGLHRDAEALKRLTALVVEDAPAVRRQAATALGRIKRPAAVPALLDGLRAGGDAYLQHALIYALIQIDDREATLAGLRDPSPQVRRGALIALDEMAHGNLTQDEVTPLLDTADPALQKASLAVVSGRGWADQAAGLLDRWLAREALTPERRESVRAAVLALAQAPAVQQLVVRVLRNERTPVATRLLLLECLARVPSDKLPDAWAAEVGRSLRHPDAQVVRQAVATLRDAQITRFDESLLRLAGDEDRPAGLRSAALAAAAPRLPRLAPNQFEFLMARLDPDLPPLVRLEATGALGSARLDDGQLKTLAGGVARAGALEMRQLLPAYERSHELEVGRQLVAALDKAPGLPSVAPEVLRRTLQGYPEEVRRAAGPLFKRLEVDVEKQKARLAELAPVLKGGDVGRGQDVFFGTKASCSACHTAKGQGGQVGPDLSKIGAIRSGEQLLESVLFPSAGFARGYEPYVVDLKSGKSHAGLLRRETVEAIYLVTADRAEVRIPRADIEVLAPGKASIMPQGLDAQLGRRELADLLTFLQSLR
jgi:putative membrane-bound dehydrogenase-like protein